jgi:hypothetical protein
MNVLTGRGADDHEPFPPGLSVRHVPQSEQRILQRREQRFGLGYCEPRIARSIRREGPRMKRLLLAMEDVARRDCCSRLTMV